MYHVYWNPAAAAYSSLYFFIFLSVQLWNIKTFSSHFSQELWGLEDWNLVHTWTVGRCIVYTRIGLLLLICPLIFSIFFLSNFQTLKSFVTVFSGTVRPGRLQLGTHVDSEQMYGVYRNKAAAAYSSFYFFIFLFLQFSNVKSFRLELWGLEDWNLVHTWTVGRCIVYTGIKLLLLICPFISSVFFLFCHTFLRNCEAYKVQNLIHTWQWVDVSCIPNPAASSYLSLISFFFFLSNVQKLKIFVTLFSGTVRPSKFKFGTLVMGECIVYTRIRLLLLICPFISSFFFLSNYQIWTIFITLFSGTVRPRKLKLGTHVDIRCMYRVYRN